MSKKRIVLFNFKTFEDISFAEYIKENKGVKLLIAYPPGKGKTKTLSILRKTISKELPANIINNFKIIDDFNGETEELANILENNKFVCIAANLNFDQSGKAYKLLNNGVNFVKYLEEQSGRYAMCKGSDAWWDEAQDKLLHKSKS